MTYSCSSCSLLLPSEPSLCRTPVPPICASFPSSALPFSAPPACPIPPTPPDPPVPPCLSFPAPLCSHLGTLCPPLAPPQCSEPSWSSGTALSITSRQLCAGLETVWFPWQHTSTTGVGRGLADAAGEDAVAAQNGLGFRHKVSQSVLPSGCVSVPSGGAAGLMVPPGWSHEQSKWN